MRPSRPSRSSSRAPRGYLCVGALGLVLLLRTAPGRTQAASPCTAAHEAFAHERFAEAADLFESCAVATPGTPEPLLHEAESRFRSGDDAGAASTARRFLARSPEAPAGLYLMGQITERTGHPRESLDWFTRAAKGRTPTAADLRLVGLDYAQLEDYGQAAHWLERSVAMDARDAETWYDLGRARMMEGAFPLAERALRQAIALDPTKAKAQNNLGVTLEGENRPTEAERAYLAALALDEGQAHPSEQPYLNLGTLLLTQGKPAEALTLLEEGVALAPSDPKLREQLARALEATGALPRALEAMRVAVHLDETNARLHYQLGQMLRRAGRPDEAREELGRAETLYGAHSTPTEH